MIRKEAKAIDISNIPELLRIAEEVRTSGEPRLLRKGDEDVALVVSPADYTAAPKSKRLKKHLLALAGVWRDLDADEMIAELDQARHEAPPSPPADL